MDRRTFLKCVGGCGLASVAGPAVTVLARELEAPSYFGLHPFIEAHPEAVFVRKTTVASKEDAEGKRREALALANQIFTLRDTPGIPLTHKFAIKPNLTSAKGSGIKHAIVTDPFVVEGFIEGLKQRNVAGERIYIREGLMITQPGTGYVELSERSGVHYGDDVSRTPVVAECPDGVVLRRTKYLGPFNYPDSYLINISKFKTHPMGLTLCVKNLQGTNVPPYIRFCGGLLSDIAQDFQPDAQSHVDDLYKKHKDAGIPRWGTEQGPWMEMWIQRTIDHYSLIKPTIGLNIVEGVYGQNGDGFDGGPGAGGLPEVFTTNMLIFGKDAFRVDIIGHWLGGHEPGNFGLFHIARSRGVSTSLNPQNIPVYSWEDAGPRLTPLDRFTRTPLTTLYLQNPGEPQFHLCNEPFSYPPEPILACISGKKTPGLRVLGRQTPAHNDSALVVEYHLPAAGPVSLEICTRSGERVGMLVEGWQERGLHMTAWQTGRKPSGTYYCLLRTNGFEHAVPLMLAG